MTYKPPEWAERLSAAIGRDRLAIFASGKDPSIDDPGKLWAYAINSWHVDGDKREMIELVEGRVQPPPEMLAVACEAVADALRGDRTRARNFMSPDLRLTLTCRARRSFCLKQEMKPTWKRTARGETLNQAVADRVNAEWRAGGSDTGLWCVPFTERHKATARTVADEVRAEKMRRRTKSLR